MLLAINANNTNTSFAMWDGAALKGSWRTATEGKRTADEYVVWLDHLLTLDGLSRAQIEGAAIASVVPETNFNLVTFCRKYCRAEPLVVGDPKVILNTRALVDRPEEVGADRLVNTVAAHDRVVPAPSGVGKRDREGESLEPDTLGVERRRGEQRQERDEKEMIAHEAMSGG